MAGANMTKPAATDFEAAWCPHCVHYDRDEWEMEDQCEVLSQAAYGLHPEEWVVRDGIPWCAAFKEDKTNPARCLFTKEMF